VREIKAKAVEVLYLHQLKYLHHKIRKITLKKLKVEVVEIFFLPLGGRDKNNNKNNITRSRLKQNTWANLDLNQKEESIGRVMTYINL
jgi:hypothetical protein